MLKKSPSLLPIRRLATWKIFFSNQRFSVLPSVFPEETFNILPGFDLKLSWQNRYQIKVKAATQSSLEIVTILLLHFCRLRLSK